MYFYQFLCFFALTARHSALKEKAKYRAPTEAELRSMCWQCIANGANGLVLYSYFDLFKQPNGERAETRWAECCRVGAEIQAQIPVLLSVEGAGRTLVRAVEMRVRAGRGKWDEA